MVMRIEELKSSASAQRTFTGHLRSRAWIASNSRGIAHTGQDCASMTSSSLASLLLRERLVASRLDERRLLRVAQLRRKSEMTLAFTIDLDEQLLTGDLDQDITILDIVA